MRRLSVAVLAVLSVAPPARAASPWADWKPLLGWWEAEVPGGKGFFTLEAELGDRVLVRKNHAEYAATKDKPEQVHDDLMIVFTDGDKTRADYYDSEGHIIHYAVTMSAADRSVVFLSDAQPGAPRFRLTYTFKKKDALGFTFDIAAPGAPEFKPYLSATMHRAK